MIFNLVHRYVAAPLAWALAKIPYEPVVIFGAGAEILLALNSELEKGVTLQYALSAVIVGFGTRLVRQNVWPSVKVNANGVAEEPLGEPVTGLEID